MATATNDDRSSSKGRTVWHSQSSIGAADAQRRSSPESHESGSAAGSKSWNGSQTSSGGGRRSRQRELARREEEPVVDRGFITKRWAPVPRHLEEAEPEYLAKKRKGLVSTTPNNVTQIGPEDMRKTKVRRVDSDGNSYITEVIAAQGQKVDGDVIEETPLTDGAAPGTVVEGLGVVNAEGVVVVDGSAQATPQRRRPPPPRRKPKRTRTRS